MPPENLVTLMFCLDDLGKAIASPFYHPDVAVVFGATGSRREKVALVVVRLVVLVSCAANTVTSNSRQLWFVLESAFRGLSKLTTCSPFVHHGRPPFNPWLVQGRLGAKTLLR